MFPDLVIVFQIHFWYWQWPAPKKTSTELRYHRWIWKRTYTVLHPTMWHVSRFGNGLPDSLLIYTVSSTQKKNLHRITTWWWISKRTMVTMDSSTLVLKSDRWWQPPWRANQKCHRAGQSHGFGCGPECFWWKMGEQICGSDSRAWVRL
jgi:hypothetical protein